MKNRLLIILFLGIITVFTLCNIALADIHIISKKAGNTTTYYLNNKAIATYRTKKMSNGYIEVETYYYRDNLYKYFEMTPMQAEKYQQVFKRHIENFEKDIDCRKVSPEEMKRNKIREKQEQQRYLSDHAALVKEIETFQKKLPNVDFKLSTKCKSNYNYNTLIKDTYSIFVAPKEKFNFIPQYVLFDGDLQYVHVPSEYDSNPYLTEYCKITKPVFMKYPITSNFNNRDTLRYMYIHNKYYKNPNLFPPKGHLMEYEIRNPYAISLDDVRKWFEFYKKTLAPYLEEYEKVKAAMAKIEKEENLKYRNNLISTSNTVKKKYPNKKVADFISNKQKKELQNINYNFAKQWELSLEQLYNLKLGSYYMAKGIEIDIDTLSDTFLKEQKYFLVDKNLIKELQKNKQTNADTDVDFSMYMNYIQNKISSNFQPSREKINITTEVLFKVAKDGRLLDYSVIKSSGDAEFDKNALRAIWFSSPFKPLPKNFTENSVDIQFKFFIPVNKDKEYKIIPLK